MKIFQKSLRVWIATASVAGFFGGWVLLAHAPKPGPVAQDASQIELAPVPTLAPIPSIQGQNRNFQQFSVAPQTRQTLPRFRTGGS
jgi:hypothetical protein